jgi:hypothetical protein
MIKIWKGYTMVGKYEQSGVQADTEISAAIQATAAANQAATDAKAATTTLQAAFDAYKLAHPATPPPIPPTPVSTTKWGACLSTDGPTQANVDKMQALFGGVKSFRAFDNAAGPGTWGRDGETKVTPDCTVISSYKLDPVGVAAGTYDARWVALWKSTPLPAVHPGQIYWSYAHEGDKKVKDGAYTLAQLMAAWKHLIALWRATPGVAHTKPMPIWTAWILEPSESSRNIDGYLLDVPDLGFDVYSKAQVTEAQTYNKKVGKDLHVCEFGADQKVTKTDDEMVTYFNDTDKMWTILKPKTICYFNATVGGLHPLDNRPKAAAIWKAYCDR